MTVQTEEVDMPHITRRRFLRHLFTLPLLGSAIVTLSTKDQDGPSGDRLLLVNGWVILESDLS